MEKIGDIRPAAELSPEMIKTICNAISQEFYRWETMTRKKSNNDNVVEIDSELYERLALMAMEIGRDNVTDFINDMIENQLRREQEQEEKG